MKFQNEFHNGVVGEWAVRCEGEAAVQQPSAQEAGGQAGGPGGGEHPQQVHHVSNDRPG